MDFKRLELSDKELIESYIKPKKHMGCEYAFANMILWNGVYQVEYMARGDVLYIRSKSSTGCVYFLPVTSGSLCEAVQVLTQYRCEKSGKLYVMGVNERQREYFENCCGTCFEFEQRRDLADYIYLREELATLEGKKFHAKRNHINKFISLYGEPVLEPMHSGNLDEVLELDAQWRAQNSMENEAEKQAVENAIRYFEQLGLSGALLRVDGKAVAFTIGSELSDETFDIHMEKADTSYQGAYAVINNGFAKMLERYTYLNREEDMGIEGLRKAKLSYNPHLVLNKYVVKFVKGEQV